MTTGSTGGGTPEARAAAIVRTWLRDRSAALTCGTCREGVLTVTNASVMPYAEWYLIDCARCGERLVHHHMVNRPRLVEEI